MVLLGLLVINVTEHVTWFDHRKVRVILDQIVAGQPFLQDEYLMNSVSFTIDERSITRALVSQMGAKPPEEGRYEEGWVSVLASPENLDLAKEVFVDF